METVQDPVHGSVVVGKNRNPFAIILFSIITFGVYWLVWWYRVNLEIRSHEPRIKVNLGWSTFAQVVPIANLVGHYNLATRIQQMAIADQQPNTISPLAAFLLLVFFGVGYIFQVQSHLNAHWDKHRFSAQAPQAPSLPVPQVGPAL